MLSTNVLIRNWKFEREIQNEWVNVAQSWTETVLEVKNVNKKTEPKGCELMELSDYSTLKLNTKFAKNQLSFTIFSLRSFPTHLWPLVHTTQFKIAYVNKTNLKHFQPTENVFYFPPTHIQTKRKRKTRFKWKRYENQRK